MDKKLMVPFIKSTVKMLHEMTGIKVKSIGQPQAASGEFESLGVSSTLSFAGKLKGRFILDLDPELAKVISGKLLGTEIENMKDTLALAGISEMNNTIAGDANTVLNNEFSLGLRLAPPIVFVGKGVTMASANMDSVSVTGETDYGAIRVFIGSQGGRSS